MDEFDAFWQSIMVWIGMGAFACLVAFLITIDPDEWRDKL